MKRLIAFAAAAALAAVLAGCNGTAPTQAQIIADVQSATVAACAVEPTAASIATLIAGANAGTAAGVAIASQIAAQICKAVASTAPTSGKLSASVVPAPVLINGVEVSFEPVGSK